MLVRFMGLIRVTINFKAQKNANKVFTNPPQRNPHTGNVTHVIEILMIKLLAN